MINIIGAQLIYEDNQKYNAHMIHEIFSREKISNKLFHW